ncbi:uncharacterized protein LOC126837375 isoform X2 [Adelges cooleyi]|uniref:uncharacterized protein LOC126837375 isoform X2 n=1 Tax=Adelges cooleyi TaxID=133065 RepID=UPI00217F754D|nr:uncharacterized protein LOC126837375 isoform X2 [Adelges cooleyi]
MVTFSYFLVVLSVCICTFANDTLEKDDLVFFKGDQNNSTGYWMFVTEDGQNPDPNQNVDYILKKKDKIQYNDLLDRLDIIEDDLGKKKYLSALDYTLSISDVYRATKYFINRTISESD